MSFQGLLSGFFALCWVVKSQVLVRSGILRLLDPMACCVMGASDTHPNNSNRIGLLNGN
jgi:hypothetical protein